MRRKTVKTRAVTRADIPDAIVAKFLALLEWQPTPGDPESECLVWKGYVNEDGYGRLRIADGFRMYVHRLAIVVIFGSVPDDKEAHHTCHNRKCVRIEHLQLVTGPENEAEVAERNAAEPIPV